MRNREKGKKKRHDKGNYRGNIYPTSLLANRLQSWHMQTQRVAVFKSFNHTTAQSPMWRSSLHHWKPVLLMLSRVKYSGVMGGVREWGWGALCCWFKARWSRNNGHEKNMARLWEAAHFHHLGMHSARNGAWAAYRRASANDESSCKLYFISKSTVVSVLPGEPIFPASAEKDHALIMCPMWRIQANQAKVWSLWASVWSFVRA